MVNVVPVGLRENILPCQLALYWSSFQPRVFNTQLLYYSADVSLPSLTNSVSMGPECGAWLHAIELEIFCMQQFNLYGYILIH